MPRDVGIPNRAFPAHSLEKALQVIHTIVENGAARPMDRLLLAQSINRTPSSSEFKKLLSSSLKYGLTEGTEKADVVKPTPLGLQIAKPVSEAERAQGLVRAIRTPELLGQVYTHFNKQKLPRVDFLKNVLARQFGVENEHTEELANLVTENAKFAGILQTIGASTYINLDLVASPGSSNLTDTVQASDDTSAALQELNADATTNVEAKAPILAPPTGPKQIFVAHGKKQGSLKEIQLILNKFKIPYVVAKEEPHAGRPISLKVAEMMQQSSAGLFIFTKDEEFKDAAGNSVWRPSENVVFELGAGSMIWGKKIIILKEDGVNFASDYQDLGYITFQEGQLSSIGMQLFMELIAFDFIKVEAA
jgi:predicted nucleotide-binding protein